MPDPRDFFEAFTYDPLTGLLRWRYEASSRVPAGTIAGTRDRDGYTVVRLKGRGYKAHRVAWLLTYGSWPTGLIDHRNRKRSDNRITNLRCVDPKGNARNSGWRIGASGVRGVSLIRPTGKWKVMLTINGVRTFLGHYETKAEAERVAADAKKREHMNTYTALENEIEMWGYARGIIQHATPAGQAKKTLEETQELIDAIAADDRAEVIDAIGDIGVTLLMQCAIQGVTFVQCLAAAYDQIKDRKGYLTAEGIFVKEVPSAAVTH